MKSSTFQYVLVIIFGFLGLLGVLIFAGIIPIGGEGATYAGQVTMWGFVSNDKMGPIISEFNEENKNLFSVVYVYKDVNNYESELVNALARGEGPDLVMFPNNLIIKQGDKLMPLPYTSYPERTFKDTFAEGGEIFLMDNGVLALPIYADPLVMYWNRDLFTNAGLVSYPKTWVDFLTLSNTLTKKDNKGNIFQSAVAMGSYKNISNAKDILATLFLQVGNNIISKRVVSGDNTPQAFESTLNNTGNATESALNFFVEFSNPAKSAYSWNPSLPNSRELFNEGKLAVYFGKASEYNEIKIKNPHLNFDIAVIPQREDSVKRMTSADIVGVAIMKASKNPNTAIKVMYGLTGKTYDSKIVGALYLPSLRRDILSARESDPIVSIFNDSAVISKSWYDPDSETSNSIFRSIIESVNSGRQSSSGAIADAQIKFSEYVK